MIIEFCPYCGSKLVGPHDGPHGATNESCGQCGKSLVAIHDSAALDQRVTALERGNGRKNYEHKSKTTLFGWPVVHIAYGIDPLTQKRRVARGLIAIGEIAIGGIALGGVSVGGIAVGGSAVGLLSLGGLSIGFLFALGGLAVCFGGLAVGGCAIGMVAIGGGAAGYYAIGGGVYGAVAHGGNSRNPEALAFFQSWQQQLQFAFEFLRPLVLPLLLTPLIIFPFLRREGSEDDNPSTPDVFPNTISKPAQSQSRGMGLVINILIGAIFGLILLWSVLAAVVLAA